MFSSLFAVDQSSEPTLPSKSRLGSSDDFSLRNDFVSNCLHFFGLCTCNPSAPSGHGLSSSLTYVHTRHLTLGSHSPCDSHLNRHVLAATSLVRPVTLARRIVHLGNVIRRTCLLHSTLLFNTEASSNQLLLFADWVVLRPLTVAWKSRHTRVVLASCRSLCCNLKHSARTPTRPSVFRPCGLVQSTRIVARSTRSIWSWLASITMFITQLRQVLQCGCFSRYARSGNCSPASTRQFRSRHTSDMADVSPTTNVKTSFPRRQHEGRLRSSCVVTASSQANSVARHIGTFRCITTGTSTTQSGTRTCRTFTVL